MEFTTRRVAVNGVYGILYRVHPEKARRMCRDSQAEVVDTVSIRLCGELGSMPRGARDDGRASESSTKSTFIQRLTTGRILQHKRIHPADRRIYQVAVLENIR